MIFLKHENKFLCWWGVGDSLRVPELGCMEPMLASWTNLEKVDPLLFFFQDSQASPAFQRHNRPISRFNWA